MNAWHRFNSPETGYGLASALLFWGVLGAVSLAAGEMRGGGWLRAAWLLAGAITVYQWWTVSDFMRRNQADDSHHERQAKGGAE